MEPTPNLLSQLEHRISVFDLEQYVMDEIAMIADDFDLFLENSFAGLKMEQGLIKSEFFMKLVNPPDRPLIMEDYENNSDRFKNHIQELFNVQINSAFMSTGDVYDTFIADDRILIPLIRDLDSYPIKRIAMLQTPLFSGTEFAEFLVSHGANVNAITEPTTNMTVFKSAAIGGHKPLVKYLLEKGADPFIGSNAAVSRNMLEFIANKLVGIDSNINSGSAFNTLSTHGYTIQ